MEDLQRRATIPVFPARLNQRTATAAVGPHSEVTLTEQRRQAPGDVDATRDGIVRVRHIMVSKFEALARYSRWKSTYGPSTP